MMRFFESSFLFLIAERTVIPLFSATSAAIIVITLSNHRGHKVLKQVSYFKKKLLP